jgi:predicted RecA/RadA family phage recombinase
MNNSISAGSSVTLTAPSGGVVSGTAYLIGSLLVIAEETAAEAASFTATVRGVVKVPKVADETWTEGLAIYFDESAGKFTLDDDSASNPLVGAAVQPIVQGFTVSLATDGAADLTIDGLVATIVDYSSLSGKTVTVTVDGVDTVLTEGVDWDSETNNDTAAANLAVAIDAVVGVTAISASADVTVSVATGIDASTPGTGAVRLDGVAR